MYITRENSQHFVMPTLVCPGMSMHRNSHIDGMSLPSSCSASDWLKQILLVVNQSEADVVSDESMEFLRGHFWETGAALRNISCFF